MVAATVAATVALAVATTLTGTVAKPTGVIEETIGAVETEPEMGAEGDELLQVSRVPDAPEYVVEAVSVEVGSVAAEVVETVAVVEEIVDAVSAMKGAAISVYEPEVLEPATETIVADPDVEAAMENLVTDVMSGAAIAMEPVVSDDSRAAETTETAPDVLEEAAVPAETKLQTDDIDTSVEVGSVAAEVVETAAQAQHAEYETGGYFALVGDNQEGD
ncbi:hypothetical protein PInf_019229 [Phytophthora infestans]|nr:hypothetical protein PInf_019229 [Phytophthora infestans]